MRRNSWWLATVLLIASSSDDVTGGQSAYHPLFNGKDLSGWQGNMKVWRVERGILVGDSPGLPNNEFLSHSRKFGDFELRATFRLVGGKGNSGIQFRSKRIPNHHEMIGYQADIGEQYWGCLYDESRRNRVLVHPPAELARVLKMADWNTYVIRCEKSRIHITLNGLEVVHYVEKEANIDASGLIAVQVHSSKEPLRVEFKEIAVRDIPVRKDPVESKLQGQ